MSESRPRSAKTAEGIVTRHRRGCASEAGSSCSCRPAYQAQAHSPREGRTIRKTFATLAEARAWRQETQVAIRRRTIRAPLRTTVEETASEWLAAAQAGVIRTRSGEPYKPSALRAYEGALRTKLVPAIGRKRLSALGRNDVQDLVDRLVAQGDSPSTVRNAILPLRAIYRRALERSEVAVNPTEGLRLPAVRGRRDRVARPEDAHALIEALPAGDRALWATVLYAGLRRGELQALRWEDVDFDRGVICVERGWDRVAGPIPFAVELRRRSRVNYLRRRKRRPPAPGSGKP